MEQPSPKRRAFPIPASVRECSGVHGPTDGFVDSGAVVALQGRSRSTRREAPERLRIHDGTNELRSQPGENASRVEHGLERGHLLGGPKLTTRAMGDAANSPGAVALIAAMVTPAL